MKILRFLKSFRADDSGSLALDWPSLTAAIIGFGQVIMTVVGSGVTGLGDAVVIDKRSHRMS